MAFNGSSMHLSCTFFQEELYKIIHGILVNSETREAAMHYIATVLNRNVKKSQIQVFFIFCLVNYNASIKWYVPLFLMGGKFPKFHEVDQINIYKRENAK